MQMRYSNCVVLMGWCKSQSTSRKMKPGFLAVGDSDGVNKWDIMWKAESSVSGSSQNTEYVRNPHQKMTTRLLLIIKCGSSFDHVRSISADTFLFTLKKNSIFLESTEVIKRESDHRFRHFTEA